MIRRSHKMLKPTWSFVVMFYIMKAVKEPKLLWKQIIKQKK